MTRGRIDNTQREIVNALRQYGAVVQSLADIGKGCPDLLVGYKGIWFVVEVKTPGGRLTDDEFNWHTKARSVKCKVHVVKSIDEALDTLRFNLQ